ncbi:MAG: hypothetical protein Q8K93_29100 [Reyranella sp.]|uniref:hypothetical protein n=1 Tax=Reyranella sp. TaxID=1929291 RepID=UPI002730714C|nr:hypothetical protein [Reyranella sp.]MDP1966247.1 hypothetical protein [Reyranella sp.]MDP2376203.1 hypothetical protein [Reyranella sp.]
MAMSATRNQLTTATIDPCRVTFPKGQYSAGVAQLKAVLQRQQIPVPAAPSVAAQ